MSEEINKFKDFKKSLNLKALLKVFEGKFSKLLLVMGKNLCCSSNKAY